MRVLGFLLGSAVLLAAAAGCASHSPYVQSGFPPADGSSPGPGTPVPAVSPAGGAVAAVAAGVVAAGVSRASGGCVATCIHGYVCNAKTGLCDELPCGGTCQTWEVCVADHGDAPRCRTAVVPPPKP